MRKSGALASRRLVGSSNMGAARAMSGKDIKFGVEGRAAMLKGVDTLADAVQVSNFRLAGWIFEPTDSPLLKFHCAI